MPQSIPLGGWVGGIFGAREVKVMAKCEICNTEAQIRQTCSQCGKKFCPACRNTSSPSKPICKVCAGE